MDMTNENLQTLNLIRILVWVPYTPNLVECMTNFGHFVDNLSMIWLVDWMHLLFGPKQNYRNNLDDYGVPFAGHWSASTTSVCQSADQHVTWWHFCRITAWVKNSVIDTTINCLFSNRLSCDWYLNYSNGAFHLRSLSGTQVSKCFDFTFWIGTVYHSSTIGNTTHGCGWLL